MSFRNGRGALEKEPSRHSPACISSVDQSEDRSREAVCLAPTVPISTNSHVLIRMEGESAERFLGLAQNSLSASALAERLALLGRSLHSIGYAEGLYPAQWAALRYFAAAADDARTASCLARFQGLANGPVSRTVRTLLQKKLLCKCSKQPVGRAEYLEVSEQGKALLQSDPVRRIAASLEDLDQPDRLMLDEIVATVLKATSNSFEGSSRKIAKVN